MKKSKKQKQKTNQVYANISLRETSKMGDP